LLQPAPAGRKKIESRGKVKMSPKFQKFSVRCKTTRENRKPWPRVQIFSRTLGVPPEIRNRSRAIEKFHGKTKCVAENLKRQLKIQISNWRASLSGQDLNFRAKIQMFSGSSAALPEH
jgi:hypothetical protein